MRVATVSRMAGADHPETSTLPSRIAGLVAAAPDDTYTRLTTEWAVMGAPAVIVRPITASDVSEAIEFAQAASIPIAVRSGGHSGPQFGTYDGALVIDLSELNDVVVHPDGLVSVGAGATWGQVAAALAPHNLAITSGDTRSVGVGGLTLLGGFGWLVREHGLALDSLFQVEIVTADGKVLRADATENSDLYWAVRGGGGNFGVVTRFVFRAQGLPGVVAGAITVGATTSTLSNAIRQWRDAMRMAPEILNSTFMVMPAFGDEPPTTQVLVCYGGTDEAAASAAMSPLLGMADVSTYAIGAQAYADLLEDPQAPEAPVKIVANNGFASNFADDVIDALVVAHQELSGMVMIRYLRGAFNRVPADATAFAYRDAEVLIISATFVPLDAPPEAVNRVATIWDGVRPHTSGTYGNFTVSSGASTTEEMYPPETLRRLREVKHRYDPQNVFRRNHNIAPE
jgi:FAD/FMN-containing dehydrogenase